MSKILTFKKVSGFHFGMVGAYLVFGSCILGFIF